MLKLVLYEVKFLLGSRLTINDEGDDEDVFRDIDVIESQGGGSASEVMEVADPSMPERSLSAPRSPILATDPLGGAEASSSTSPLGGAGSSISTSPPRGAGPSSSTSPPGGPGSGSATSTPGSATAGEKKNIFH